MSNYTDTPANRNWPSAWRRTVFDGAYVDLGIDSPRWWPTTCPKAWRSCCTARTASWAWAAPAAGDEDYDLINAGKQPVTLLPGGAYFHHADSFAMMRGSPGLSDMMLPGVGHR